MHNSGILIGRNRTVLRVRSGEDEGVCGVGRDGEIRSESVRQYSEEGE